MTTPADWYPDPSGSGGLRYWDGTTWTDHTAPAPAAVPAEEFRSAQGLGAAAIAVTLVLLVVQVAVALTAFPARDRWRESVEDTGTTTAYLTLYDGLTIVQFVAMLAAYVVTCLWLWRVRVNAEVLRPSSDHQRRRGWVWGGWICPVVGLWFPFQVVRDVRKATSDRRWDTGRVLTWWWAFVTFEVCTNFAGRLSTSVDTYEAVAPLEVVGLLGTLAAAPLWILIIREINRDQEAADLQRFGTPV